MREGGELNEGGIRRENWSIKTVGIYTDGNKTSELGNKTRRCSFSQNLIPPKTTLTIDVRWYGSKEGKFVAFLFGRFTDGHSLLV